MLRGPVGRDRKLGPVGRGRDSPQDRSSEVQRSHTWCQRPVGHQEGPPDRGQDKRLQKVGVSYAGHTDMV